ncbi:unnamed protein product, partial [Nesidiocoris tenuis]
MLPVCDIEKAGKHQKVKMSQCHFLNHACQLPGSFNSPIPLPDVLPEGVDLEGCTPTRGNAPRSMVPDTSGILPSC